MDAYTCVCGNGRNLVVFLGFITAALGYVHCLFTLTVYIDRVASRLQKHKSRAA